jgi:Sec-independent protein translocase protein TatA
MVSLSDPLLWIGVLVLLLLLGPTKLPQLARATAEAVKEWRRAFEEASSPHQKSTQQPQPPPQYSTQYSSAETSQIDYTHPIVAAAIKEGIDVRGKTLDQIAEELARKLREKSSKQSI